jgi:membrane-associated phospholipid phosphatase
MSPDAPSPLARAEVEGPAALFGLSLWLLPLVCSLASLVLWASGVNQALFVALNSGAQLLPAALWAQLTLLGHTCAAFALAAPWFIHRPAALMAAMLAIVPASSYSLLLKRSLDAERPAAVLASGDFHVIGQTLYHHSFPSGHTITAFALAAAIWFTWPGPRAGLHAAWRWAVLVLATLVGWSRVAVGAHWPLDVLMGAAGGWLGGWAGTWLMARWPASASPMGLRLGWLALAGMCVSLAWIDSGYPLADPLQAALLCWGLVGLVLNRSFMKISGERE